MKNKFNFFIFALIALSIVTGCNKTGSANKIANNSNAANAATENKSAATNANVSAPMNVNPNITAANFAKLQNGMTYKEVVKILGAEGELLSNYEIPELKTVMYQWKGEGYGATPSLKLVFQNDKLVDKANTGVK